MRRLDLYLWIGVGCCLTLTLGLVIPGLAWRQISPGCTANGVEDHNTTCWIGVTLLSVGAFCFLIAVVLLLVLYAEGRKRVKEAELQLLQQQQLGSQTGMAVKEGAGGGGSPAAYPHKMPKNWDAAAPYAMVRHGRVGRAAFLLEAVEAGGKSVQIPPPCHVNPSSPLPFPCRAKPF